MAHTTAESAASVPRHGIDHWMHRVVKEADRAALDLDAKTVHALRVALRRSRTTAGGMAEMDPRVEAEGVKKTGRKLFRRLGKLRDAQVMREWVLKLSRRGDPARRSLLKDLHATERKLREQTTKALEHFDRARWKKLAGHLTRRSRRLELDGPEAQRLARAKLEEAMRLHRRALRTNRHPDWHALRIGIKRFRYVVENFLPARHAAWGDDLKQLQDLLGDVHDLNVLWEELLARKELPASLRNRWRMRILKEERSRLVEYRRKMTGRKSSWAVWRAGLTWPISGTSGRLHQPTRTAPEAVSAARAKGARPAAA